jgi:hypothetical protein
MIRGLILYLSLRRLRGRTVAVKTGPEGMLALRDASFSPFGVRGLALDGDHAFVPWAAVGQVHWGPGTDRLVARKLKTVAAVASGDGDDADSPFAALARALAAGQGAEPDERTPALSPEEIEAILAEDADEPSPGRV